MKSSENSEISIQSYKRLCWWRLDIAKSKNSKVIVNDLSKIKVLENKKLGQVIDYKDFKNLKINLLGSHQVKNATISLDVIQVNLFLNF